jgi:hypothetical protein
VALKDMTLALRRPEPPEVRLGKQCSTTYDCPFYSYCHAGETEHAVLSVSFPGPGRSCYLSLKRLA